MEHENKSDNIRNVHDEYYEQAYHDRIVLHLASIIADTEFVIGLTADEDTLKNIVANQLVELEDKNIITKQDSTTAYEHFIKRFGEVS